MTDRAIGCWAALPRVKAFSLLACVFVVGSFTPSALAQRVVPRHSRVVLAVVSKLPEMSGEDIALVRRTPAAPDTVLLRSTAADPEGLTAAVFKLLATRQLMGSIVERAVSIRVPSRAVPAAWTRGEVPAAAAAAVRRVRATAPQVLPGLGLAYVTTIALTNRPVLSRPQGAHPGRRAP
jgi:hypothetical protein